LLWLRNTHCVTVLRRSQRRAAGGDVPVRSFGTRRVCAANGCGVRLSSYNPGRHCSIHRGWDLEPPLRRRRRPRLPKRRRESGS
jgi:hypothetical protein